MNLAASLDDCRPEAPPSLPSPGTWINRFASLGAAFFTELKPAALPSPAWGAISEPCAAELGWSADWLRDDATQALQVFSGNALWPGMETRHGCDVHSSTERKDYGEEDA